MSDTLTALVEKWREFAKDADRLATKSDAKNDGANSHAFRKERRVWKSCADELAAALQQAAPARSAWQDSRGFVLPTYVAVITREDGSVILEGHTRTQDWELEVDAHGAAESFYFQAKPLPTPPTTGGTE